MNPLRFLTSEYYLEMYFKIPPSKRLIIDNLIAIAAGFVTVVGTIVILGVVNN